MAINVDTVYQTVQALANKEQRGYLTPQEFNLFANQAQQDMFEQYFYDLNAFRLRGVQLQLPEILRQTGDSIQMIMDKFENTGGVTVEPRDTVNSGTQLPKGRTGRIFVTKNSIRKTVRLVEGMDEIQYLLSSRWHKAGFHEAVYFEDGYRNIQVWDGNGQITSGVTCENITGKPGLVYWNYIIVNEKPVYNNTNSKNFDLPAEEQPDIVAKILKLAGISIEDPQLYQAAGQEEQQNTQQESK
jgi:hypothetical protein